jgi:hypothetical protein
METRKWALAAAALLLSIFSCPSSAFSQAGSPVQLQTVSATVAANATCTGIAQNFTTAQGIPNFINIGQTNHLATATSNAVAFQMEIDGIDNAGNVFRLSDVQVGVPSSAVGGLVVTANGYMTNIQIKVTCTAAATFTVSYTGSFSSYSNLTASTLLASEDKLPFQTAAANANSSSTFQTPSGNSSGTLIFQYAASGPAGSTVTAQCLSNANADLALFTFSPATPAGAQLFPVSASACPFVTLAYASGGASATTYSLEYVFNPVGVQTTTNDPCTSGAAKQSASIPLIDSASTVQIAAAAAGKTIYPCTIALEVDASGTTATAQFEYGTGSLCGTGTTTVSGPLIFNNNVLPFVVSGGSQFNLPAGNAFCILVTGSLGGTSGMGGWMDYVQQ